MSTLLRKLYQRLRLANRRRLYRRSASKKASYAQWAADHDTLGDAQIKSLRLRLENLQGRPLISVLMPIRKPTREWFERAVDSVSRQLYPHWELCISDDASDPPWLASRLSELQQQEPRIRKISRTTHEQGCAAANSALEVATGDWVTLLDQNDELRAHALLLMAEAACALPDAGMIYSDEDQLDALGQRSEPIFKPAWNHDLCLSCNYVGHLLVIRASLMRELGGLRTAFEDAAEHDLVLRASERLKPDQIVHIPHVLYHRRAHRNNVQDQRMLDTRPADEPALHGHTFAAGRRCIEDHLHRLGHAARVEALAGGHYRVHWALPSPTPWVSILIPTRNQADLLRTCLESLKSITDYPSYEILIIDNGSDEPDALALLEHWGRQPRVQVIRDDSPFNYSALNNRAARQAQGSVLVLMNNDIEILHSDWLTEMVSQACRPGVGAVGAKLLYPDRTVQHAGVILGTNPESTMGGVAGHAHRGIPGEAEGYMHRAALAQQFSAVTAACLAISRRCFDAVGGFEEANLAVAFNDVDFCLRLEDIGLTNVWTPFALLVHHESVSRGKDKLPKNLERYLGERAYMLRRWGDRLTKDPQYNPNLGLVIPDFTINPDFQIDWSRPTSLR